MPTTHTIQQGETLTRIAQQYKFSSWKDLNTILRTVFSRKKGRRHR